MNVKLKRESRLLIMAITSVALFVHIVVICAASTREVVANKEFVFIQLNNINNRRSEKSFLR